MVWDGPAVRKLYEAKLRPAGKAIPVLLANAADLALVAGNLSGDALRLATRFWPGPLTLVVPRAESVPDEVTAGGATVAEFTSGTRANGSMSAVRLYVAVPSTSRVTVSRMFPAPFGVQLDPGDAAQVQVAPMSDAGSVSVTVAPVTAAGPVFVTVIVYVTGVPGTAVAWPSLLPMARSSVGVVTK